MARNAVVAPSAAPRAPSSATRRAAPTTADPRAATPQQPVSERTVGGCATLRRLACYGWDQLVEAVLDRSWASA